jgi:hypothetical protein
MSNAAVTCNSSVLLCPKWRVLTHGYLALWISSVETNSSFPKPSQMRAASKLRLCDQEIFCESPCGKVDTQGLVGFWKGKDKTHHVHVPQAFSWLCLFHVEIRRVMTVLFWCIDFIETGGFNWNRKGGNMRSCHMSIQTAATYIWLG